MVNFSSALLNRFSGRVNAWATSFITSGFGSPKFVWFCQVKDFLGFFLRECLRNVVLFAEILEQHLTLVFEIGGWSLILISCISSPFLKAGEGTRKLIFFFFSQSSLSWFLILLTPNMSACSLSIFHSTGVHQMPLSLKDGCVWYQPGGHIRNSRSSNYGKRSLS